MARQSRLILPGQAHHVLQRGNDNQLLFRSADDYLRLLGWLGETARACQVAIHAYVLLPNQLQLLATPGTAEALAALMQKLGRLYVPWYNTKYGRRGGLFEGRFRTAVVAPDHHLLLCSRFIELAPVRSSDATDAGAYPWSSYRHHAGVQADSLITEHARFWELGNTPFQREAAYTELAGQGLSAASLTQVGGAVEKGQPLGSAEFKRELERLTGRRILPAKRGRPVKAESSPLTP